MAWLTSKVMVWHDMKRALPAHAAADTGLLRSKIGYGHLAHGMGEQFHAWHYCSVPVKGTVRRGCRSGTGGFPGTGHGWKAACDSVSPTNGTIGREYCMVTTWAWRRPEAFQWLFVAEVHSA